MHTLTLGASNLQVASGLCGALSSFRPKVTEASDGSYQVVVELGDDDTEIGAILAALEQFVADRENGSVRVQLDGRRYMLHAV
jgi:hypothetical protein